MLAKCGAQSSSKTLKASPSFRCQYRSRPSLNLHIEHSSLPVWKNMVKKRKPEHVVTVHFGLVGRNYFRQSYQLTSVLEDCFVSNIGLIW